MENEEYIEELERAAGMLIDAKIISYPRYMLILEEIQKQYS